MVKKLDKVEYLKEDEWQAVLKAAKLTQHPIRDYAMILLAGRHGLRASELLYLERPDFDLKMGTIRITRLKNGQSDIHPMSREEITAVKKALALHDNKYAWYSEQGNPLSYTALDYLIRRIGHLANLERPIHFHMLRHTCGFRLINRGWDVLRLKHWLGHKSINSTMVYASLNESKFKDLPKDF